VSFSYYWEHEVFRDFVTLCLTRISFLFANISYGGICKLCFFLKWQASGTSSLFASQLGVGYMFSENLSNNFAGSDSCTFFNLRWFLAISLLS